MLQIDHFVISCETLAQGQAWLNDRLGVTLQAGGQHAHFGTHNMLLGLNDGLYLEIICVDPDAPKPDYDRWFNLDRFDGAPRPTTWVARTDSLADSLTHCPKGAGTPVPLTRGDLRWQMAVPADGALPYDGLFPALIEWDGNAHPAARLNPQGVTFKRAVLSHPDHLDFTRALNPLISDDRITVQRGDPSLTLIFDTPMGEVTL